MNHIPWLILWRSNNMHNLSVEMGFGSTNCVLYIRSNQYSADEQHVKNQIIQNDSIPNQSPTYAA